MFVVIIIIIVFVVVIVIKVILIIVIIVFIIIMSIVITIGNISSSSSNTNAALLEPLQKQSGQIASRAFSMIRTGYQMRNAPTTRSHHFNATTQMKYMVTLTKHLKRTVFFQSAGSISKRIRCMHRENSAQDQT